MNANQAALIPTHIVLSDGAWACSYLMPVPDVEWSAVPADHEHSARHGIWNETPIKIDILRSSESYICVCLKGPTMETQYANAVIRTNEPPWAGDTILLPAHKLVISRDDVHPPVIRAASAKLLAKLHAGVGARP